MFRPISGHPQVHNLCLKHIEQGTQVRTMRLQYISKSSSLRTSLLAQYVLNTNFVPNHTSKHVVQYNKWNLVVFRRNLT
jgi:hypothetical protein